MEVERSVAPPDDDNPYRAPKESEGLRAVDQTAGRSFRVRLIPATLLVAVSTTMLVLYLCVGGVVIYANVCDRWIAPDPWRLKVLNEEVFSPPFIAHCISSITASVCGLLAAKAWMRQAWIQAMILATAFLLLMAIVNYISVDVI